MTVPPKGANEKRSDCQELELTSEGGQADEFNKDYGFSVTPRYRPEVNRQITDTYIDNEY